MFIYSNFLGATAWWNDGAALTLDISNNDTDLN